MAVSVSSASPITKCMFCDGYVPASFDDVYIKHMNDHHRAFVNIQFLFQISLLSDDDLSHLFSLSNSITEKQAQLKSDSENIDQSFDFEKNDKLDDNNEEMIEEDEIDVLESNTDSTTTPSKTEKGRETKRKSRQFEDFYPTKQEFQAGVCGDCVYVAANKQTLTDHKSIHHDETKLDCEICGRVIKGKRRMKSHLNAHKQTMKGKVDCPECHKKVNKLRDHMVTMHSERQYACDLCEKKFNSEAKLKLHTVVHFDVKPFVCRFGCSFAAKNSGNRTKHEIHKHNAKSELDTKAMIESGELMIDTSASEKYFV